MEPETSNRHGRLHWQCRRGMRELDLLLGAYLEQRYDRAPASEQQAFERLLSYPDQVLFEVLLGRQTLSEKELADVVARIRAPADP